MLVANVTDIPCELCGQATEVLKLENHFKGQPRLGTSAEHNHVSTTLELVCLSLSCGHTFTKTVRVQRR